MKTRVFFQGTIICVVIWVLVFAAQGYFRGMRRTAENLGKVANAEEFADWSEDAGEADGEETRAREGRIREVAALLSKLEYSEEGKVRQSAIKNQFYAKLSPSERALFVKLLLGRFEPYITLFDALPEERRQHFLKQAFKEAEAELSAAQQVKLKLVLDETTRDKIAQVGWRTMMKEKKPDEVMEHIQLLEIVGELLERRRVRRWEGRGRSE